MFNQSIYRDSMLAQYTFNICFFVGHEVKYTYNNNNNIEYMA